MTNNGCRSKGEQTRGVTPPSKTDNHTSVSPKMKSRKRKNYKDNLQGELKKD